jgi:glycine/D-amino acid oxidase-like deaminating enzyme
MPHRSSGQSGGAGAPETETRRGSALLNARRVSRYDIIVSGAGVAGLWHAKKLAELGYSVLVVEKGPILAGYSSTRNEGWLHRGTYHGGAIPVRDIALHVARQTANGYEQTLAFAPEAVEEKTAQTFALIKHLDVSEVESRWLEVGVPFERITDRAFAGLVPEVRTEDVSAFFRVDDVSINTRVLYLKLLEDATRHGGRFLVNGSIRSFDGMRAYVETPSGVEICEAGMFVYAAGFGIKDFFLTRFDKPVDLKLRMWKSHLIDLPRAARHGVFCLDAGEATLMHHKHWTIAGFNSDSTAVTEASFDTVMPGNVEADQAALRRMLYNVDFGRAKPRACIKVDQDPGADVDVFVASDGTSYPRPQLGVTFGQPLPGHLWVLPGKMTEAPYVADKVISVIRSQINPTRGSADPARQLLPRIAKRAIDTYPRMEGVSTGPAFGARGKSAT